MTKCERIIAEVPIEEVLQRYGITVQPKRHFACFVHNEKTPSMAIRNRRAHCFGCHWSGNVIDVVQHFERCDAKEAVSIINRWYRLFEQIEKAERTFTQRIVEKREKQQERQKREVEKQERTNKQVEVQRRLDEIADEINWTERFIYFLDDQMAEIEKRIKSYGRSKTDELPLAPCDSIDNLMQLIKVKHEGKKQLNDLIEQEFWLSKEFKSISWR